MTATLTLPPRHGLCRSAPFTLLRAEPGGNGDGLTFEGYAAVFNSPTRIDSCYEGCFDEQIAPGAFAKSVREQTPKFQFDHGQSVFGSLPCGVITDIHEDDRGLFTGARMAASSYWEPLREALSTKAVNGMSFRFSVVNEVWVDKNGKVIRSEDELYRLMRGDQPDRLPLLRTLKEVKVAEVGPVVWPAYSDTSAGVRAHYPTAVANMSVGSIPRALAARQLRLLEVER